MNAVRKVLIHNFLGLSMLFALLSAPCNAQVATGTLLGVVTDPSGSVVAGAQVSVRNPATGLVKTQITSSEGLYSFPLLTVGKYELTIEFTGFKKLVQSNIGLAGGRPYGSMHIWNWERPQPRLLSTRPQKR
jgi:Carboxypeptidase regulatory-like domain